MLDPDDMLRLMALVEEQGGAAASGKCNPRKFKLKMRGVDGVLRTKDYVTTGCGQESRFLIPYQKPDKQLAGNASVAGAEGTAVACAHDDMMDRWPRFMEN